MSAPVAFFPDFLDEQEAAVAFVLLRDQLDWVRRDGAPRSEYWTNTFDRPYTYGRDAGRRTYAAQPAHRQIDAVRAQIERETGHFLEGCFLNLYHDGSDSLGWHADDDPGIDHDRPILVLTLGAGRDIAFKPQISGAHPQTLHLDPGSLLVMQAGMQHTHLHAIPKIKVDPHLTGARISLTFRGLRP